MTPPQLPPELECEIFETAARNYRDNFESSQVINLSLVARRVHFWVEPVFLEVIALWDENHAKKFLKLADMKSVGFLANAVRALCIPYQVDTLTAHRILSVCTGVRMLACWVDYRNAPASPPLTVNPLSLLISRLPLTRLEIELDHFLHIPLDTSTWRSTLTQLDLTFWDPMNDPARLSSLRRLPRLTRVTLSGGNIALARALCSSIPSLEVVRLEREDVEDADSESDPKIISHWRPDTYRGQVHRPNKHWLLDLL
ncbi:hypothetical protein C8J57DRAFT_338150 [Mycena rebaudengoi]|nr:hypothetical protein C8J57DRAFT_338150 [Mycena rebaudengoi]